MAKFKVLRPIEHNRVLHLPARAPSGAGRDAGSSTEKALSGADGKDIPIDSSGLIDLTSEEAAALTAGQIERVKKESSPVGGQQSAKTAKTG